MTQRTRDLLILFVVALSVNGAIALLITNPGYTDSYYYFNGGLFLAEQAGHQGSGWCSFRPGQTRR